PPAPVQLADLGSSFLDDLAPAPARNAPPRPAAAAPNLPVDDLDRWLEPAAPAAAAPQAAWAPSPAASAHVPLPLGDAQETDPLALLGGGGNARDSWLTTGGDNDDWWQTAPTQSDHAPADQHQMRIPQPQ